MESKICKVCGVEKPLIEIVRKGENYFCSKDCSFLFDKSNYDKSTIVGELRKCRCCGNYFKVIPNAINQKYCSDDCKHKSKLSYQYCVKCSYCGEYVWKNEGQIKKYSNLYCSKSCESNHRHEMSHEIRKCEICGVEFKTSKTSKQRFCSISCQGKWQSISRTGENASNYRKTLSQKDRTIICEWCGKERIVGKYQVENGMRFCSADCRKDWYAKIWSQSNEWKQESKERAVRILESGVISQTNTGCQQIVNNILKQLNVNYVNEYGFKICTIDNYLLDFNLAIEVMGTFWHCDNRIYPKINYTQQADRITHDKIKNTLLKNQYNIQVLYLWEKDINDNPLLCKKLITEYIKNKGALKDYHSMNYRIKSQKLTLLEPIIVPYMYWDINELNKIMDKSVKEKKSKKQPDKWLTFNCQHCGKEKEELISHYIKKDNHFCSVKCKRDNNREKTNVTFNCDNCGKEQTVTQHKYSKSNNHFCSKKCSLLYYNKQKDVLSSQEFDCSFCNNKIIKKLTKHNQLVKNHFCNKICYDKYQLQQGEDKWITFYCEFCHKETLQLKDKYNQRNNHFCSRECWHKYRKTL